MISDMDYGTIVQRVRSDIPRKYAKIKRLPKKAQEMVLQAALVQLESFPPGIRQAAKQIIDREAARGVPNSGLGVFGAASTAASAGSTVSTLSTIATIASTVGQIGLSVYSMQEDKKLQKKADARAEQQVMMDNLMLMDQMKSTAQNRELRKRQAEQQMAAQQVEIDMMQQMAQQPAMPAGMAPGPAAPASSKGGMDTKTLLLAGGAAAAAVAAVALMK